MNSIKDIELLQQLKFKIEIEIELFFSSVHIILFSTDLFQIPIYGNIK